MDRTGEAYPKLNKLPLSTAPSVDTYRGSPVPVTRPAAAASSSATGGGAGHEHDRSEAGSVGDGTAPAVLQRATAGPAARAPPAPIAGPDKLISEGHHDGRSCQTDPKGAKRRLAAAVDRDREAGDPEAHRRWEIRRSAVQPCRFFRHPACGRLASPPSARDRRSSWMPPSSIATGTPGTTTMSMRSSSSSPTTGSMKT